MIYQCIRLLVEAQARSLYPKEMMKCFRPLGVGVLPSSSFFTGPILGSILLVQSACTFKPVQSEFRQGTAQMVQSGSSDQETSVTQADLADSGADLVGIPIEVNRLVLKWIDYFQGPGRHHMERYLARSTRYAPIMKEILRKEGLPEDLIYIALIESGFSATAHSHANAVGYWQFIRSTGKHYKLRIDSFVDERRDFERATVAAADYFKGLYNLFGAWYLAIASYNVGENRVKSVVMRNKTRDFWQLARENKLPQETVHYVPKFLAARLIAKEPDRYGFTDIQYHPPLEFDRVRFDAPIDLKQLAAGMGVDYDDIKDLNPAYKRGVAPLPRSGGSLELRVPRGLADKALAAADRSKANINARYVAEEDYSYYRIQRGDTLSGIARKLRVSQRQIMRLNRLSSRSILAIGRRIRVPSESVATLAPSRTPNEVAPSRKPAVSPKTVKSSKSGRVHIVRRGENLAVIAQRYNVSIRELAIHNKIRNRGRVMAGARLHIP